MDGKPWILNTRMLWAIKENKYSAVEAILDNGFDIDSELTIRKSAITIAILNSCVEIAKLLVSRSCSLSLKTDMGSTPLHLAVQMKNYDLVKLLLNNRADVTEVDILGKTPLHIACEIHAEDIALLLIHHAKKTTINLPDKDGKTPLLLASSHGSIRTIKSLLKNGAEINAVDCLENNALISAIFNPQCTEEIIRYLLYSGVNINHFNNLSETALLSVLRLLVQGKFKATGDTALRLQNIASVLIEDGSDVNAHNNMKESPLHLAVLSNNIFLVHKLINAGSNIDAMNAIGIVPLSYALRTVKCDIAILLIEGGANVRNVCNSTRMEFILRNPLVSERKKELDLLLTTFKCQSLSKLCRNVIRKHLKNRVDKSAFQLPLPKSLIRFVQLST